MPEEIADRRDGLALLDVSVVADVRHGLAEFLPECQAPEEERLAQSAQRGVRHERSRKVRITEVLRYSSLMTVRSGIHAEMAMAGTRTPDRSNVKPI